MYDKRAKERMTAGGGDKKSGRANLPYPIKDTGQARDQAARAFRVSGKSVDAATKVMKHAIPEVAKAVDQGRIAVSKPA
jgi:hypothetical protein